MMGSQQILERLPYSEPFLFVDEITNVSENGLTGNYTFRKKSWFYNGHFKNNPVTPGVILTECMAQIGVVCLGAFLLKEKSTGESKIALSSTNIEFFQPVFPGEKVMVVSKKIYFRFNKLKCAVKMFDKNGKLACKGEIAGLLIKPN